MGDRPLRSAACPAPRARVSLVSRGERAVLARTESLSESTQCVRAHIVSFVCRIAYPSNDGRSVTPVHAWGLQREPAFLLELGGLRHRPSAPVLSGPPQLSRNAIQ